MGELDYLSSPHDAYLYNMIASSCADVSVKQTHKRCSDMDGPAFLGVV